MKYYFDFHLAGKKFFPVWIIYFLLVLAPYFLFLRAVENSGNNPAMVLGMLFFLFFMIGGSLVFYYYLIKLSVDNLSYDGRFLSFSGKIGPFIGKALLGVFLSYITLGIYYPWFMKYLMKYFTNNSSLDDSRFDFSGNPMQLLVVFLLTLYLPVGLMMIGTVVFALLGSSGAMSSPGPFFVLFIQFVVVVFLIPFIYFAYKWMVDIRYKEYAVKWQTEFWPSCAQLLVQILLTAITFGIYFPMAYLRLYKYFVERTFAESPARILKFGYEWEPLGDFLFVWGQTLLTVVTLGIYYPWAMVKIGKRVFSKTYTQVISESAEEMAVPPPVPVEPLPVRQ